MTKTPLGSRHLEALFLKTQAIHDYYSRLRTRFEETGLDRDEPELYAYLKETTASCRDFQLVLHIRLFRNAGYGDLFRDRQPRPLRKTQDP